MEGIEINVKTIILVVFLIMFVAVAFTVFYGDELEFPMSHDDTNIEPINIDKEETIIDNETEVVWYNPLTWGQALKNWFDSFVKVIVDNPIVNFLRSLLNWIQFLFDLFVKILTFDLGENIPIWISAFITIPVWIFIIICIIVVILNILKAFPLT